MQTSATKQHGASAPIGAQASRLQAILKWADARGINQVFSFFRGCDNGLDAHEPRIRYVLRNSVHIVNEADDIWISSMEATVGALRNRKAA